MWQTQAKSTNLNFIAVKNGQQALWDELIETLHEGLHLSFHTVTEPPLNHQTEKIISGK